MCCELGKYPATNDILCIQCGQISKERLFMVGKKLKSSEVFEIKDTFSSGFLKLDSTSSLFPNYTFTQKKLNCVHYFSQFLQLTIALEHQRLSDYIIAVIMSKGFAE